MPPGYLWTKALTTKLTTVMFNHIRRFLPAIIKEINQKIKEKFGLVGQRFRPTGSIWHNFYWRWRPVICAHYRIRFWKINLSNSTRLAQIWHVASIPRSQLPSIFFIISGSLFTGKTIGILSWTHNQLIAISSWWILNDDFLIPNLSFVFHCSK